MTSLPPVDQAVRDEFTQSIDRNFSLYAPAGSGKTRAISERIATLAQAPDAEHRLPRLVAVTYTNKAADEMRQRAGAAMRAAGASPAVQRAFELGFFGTIHAFATQLLREFGYHIGVPAASEVVTAVEPLWGRFLGTMAADSTDASLARALLHLEFVQLQRIVQEASYLREIPPVPGERPELDLDEVLSYVPSRANSRPTVERGQRQIDDFAMAWRGEDGTFAAFPDIKAGGREFIALARNALQPASDWLRQAAAHHGGRLGREFQAWRKSEGLLGYDDQIALAAALFTNPEAARAVRERQYTVILDEAQDTDPGQFNVLLECARPLSAEQPWHHEGAIPPEPGHFVMVGDTSQSIYTTRADLDTCRRVETFLTRDDPKAALTFTTTFRCEREIIATVNRLGPGFLNGVDGQVNYVPLAPRPGAREGCVMPMAITPVATNEGTKPSAADNLFTEGIQVGEWLVRQGRAGLGIANWNQVAFLVPRTAWIEPLRRGLLEKGVRSVVLSQSERNCDSPAYLWTAALCEVLASPRNAWEVAGILREVYGISDSLLAEFAEAHGERFHLDDLEALPPGSGAIATALRELAELRREIRGRPLRDGFELIDRQILRPRLRNMPEDKYGDLGADIDRLGAIAAGIEADRGDLVAFAGYLREHFEDRAEALNEDSTAVCLLTNHKSKGLEWPVVILPAFARQFSYAIRTYPMVTGPLDSPLAVAFNKEDAADHLKAQDRRTAQEIERLLYVSMTRAKHLLVICDDRKLWQSQKKDNFSLATAMGLDADPGRFPAQAGDWAAIPADAQKPPPQFSKAWEIDLAGAAAQAATAPDKVTPHRLALQHDREGPESRTDDRPIHARPPESLPYVSTQYGTWWHELMQVLPWNRKGEDFGPCLAPKLSSCPDPERAEREWALFLQSPLVEIIRAADIVRTECPFLVPSEEMVLEGVIDLIFKTGDRGGIVDWKTSQGMGPAEAIRTYGPQLKPYRDAPTALLGLTECEAILYLTVRGEYVKCP